MLEKFLVRDTANSGWIVFNNPSDVILAQNQGEVLDALIEVERRVNEESLFAAGFVCYEAASGIDPAFVTHSDNRLPLVCVGRLAEAQHFDEL